MERNCHVNNSGHKMPAYPYNSLSVWTRIFLSERKHEWWWLVKALGQQVPLRADMGQAEGWFPEGSADPSPRFPPSISQDRPSPEIQSNHPSSPEHPLLPFLRDGFRTFSLFGTSLCKAYQNSTQGVSLMVQWIDICLPMQGTGVRSLVQGDSTCHGATKPMGRNYWIHVLQLLKPVCLEPALHCKGSTAVGRPCTTAKRGPCSHSERKPCTAMKTQHNCK